MAYKETEKYDVRIGGYKYRATDKRTAPGQTGPMKYWPSKRTTTFKPLDRDAPQVEPAHTKIHSQMRSPVAYRKMTDQDRRENVLRNTALASVGGYYTGGKIYRGAVTAAPEGSGVVSRLAEDVRNRPTPYSRKALDEVLNPISPPPGTYRRTARRGPGRKLENHLRRSMASTRDAIRRTNPGENIRYAVRRTPGNLLGRGLPVAAGALAGAAALNATRREKNKSRYITTYKDNRYRTAKRT